MSAGRDRRRHWWIYSASVFAVLVAFAWTSTALLDLDRGGRQNDREAQRHALLGSALWRLDSWMVPVLGREAARPWYEYQAYHQVRGSPAGPEDELWLPSPLLASRPAWIRAHFELDASGRLTSPQYPTGELREAAMVGCVAPTAIDFAGQALAEVRRLVQYESVRERVCSAEAEEEALVLASETGLEPRLPPFRPPGTAESLPTAAQPAPDSALASGAAQPEDSTPLHQQIEASNVDALNRAEWVSRSKATYASRRNGVDRDGVDRGTNPFMQNFGESPLQNSLAGWNVEGSLGDQVWLDTAEVGTFVPLWLGEGEDLFFFRRVVVDSQERLQGIWCDWNWLRSELLRRVQDLLPDARLDPVRSDSPPATVVARFSNTALSAKSADQPPPKPALVLASLPVELRALEVAQGGFPGPSPAERTLLLTWSAVLLALVATAITLRASISYGEKRSRFASAVTHELRTPLTTFRMYSEMLASGMVQDEEQRRCYYRTLEHEANRLSVLVENVLAYARVEEGRGVPHRRPVAVDDLLDRALDVLGRRCADAGTALVVERQDRPGATVLADAEAIVQVLFNLVDNACKYGVAPPGRGASRVELRLRCGAGELHVEVRDHGRGIPADALQKIFRPFDRAGKDGDPSPGIGLGLTLSRGIARDHGGDLEAVACPDGARFVLRLPLLQPGEGERL